MDSFQHALDLMAMTPGLLRVMVTAQPRGALDRKPIADGWSAREVFAHMLHVETAVIAPRIRLMLAEYDPDLPVTPAAPAPGEVDALLTAWLWERNATLAFLHRLASEQLTRTGRHRQWGRITVREHVVKWAYHDLDHVRQILATLQAELYPDIGGFQSLYPRPA